MQDKKPFILASRASQLAQVQTNIVLDALRAAFPDESFSASFMTTEGDKNQSQALYLVGGKAFWTKELEVALIDGSVDMLVHSLKDVPTTLPAGCVLGGILEREDPADSLVVKEGLSYKSLDEFPDGSVIGTSSVRRVAQLRNSYPNLKFADVRGNLNTRLAKLDSPTGIYSGLILAKAGLLRINLGHRITADITAPTLYHAVGQAALGVEIREGDERARRFCEALTHWQTNWRCRAERAMLRVLEGGCSVPVGASTFVGSLPDGLEPVDSKSETPSVLRIIGTVTALSGCPHIEGKLTETVSSVAEAEALGAKLAKMLMENGAKKILDQITKDKEARIAQSKADAATDATA